MNRSLSLLLKGVFFSSSYILKFKLEIKFKYLFFQTAANTERITIRMIKNKIVGNLKNLIEIM